MLLPLVDAERVDQAHRDRGHDHDPRDAGGHDRGQQEVRDDEAEQQLRIAVADTRITM